MLFKKFLKTIVYIPLTLSLLFLSVPTCAHSKGEFVFNNKTYYVVETGEPDTDKSGPTTYVPWEKDEVFLNSQMQNGTPVMMGAYHTVLHDPLPGEEENVHLAARLLAGIVVKPGETFSQNNKIGPYVESKGFKKGPTYIGTQLTTTIGGGVCKIASTLYNVTILSNLQIAERFAHNMPVPYVPYGQDATVSFGNKDFKFVNNSGSPILIWARGVDNILYIAFYGTAKPPEIEWHHEMQKVIKAGKVYSINPTLPVGTERLVTEGMDGAVVKSWLTIKDHDGNITTKQLGISHYNPFPHMYERSN